MKNKLIFASLILIICSCAPKLVMKSNSVGTKMLETIKLEESLNVDSITKKSKKFYSDFDSSYFKYKANKKKLDTLKGLLKNASFVVFGGSWCSDTRRELPRLSFILDKCNFPVEEFTYFGVNKAKEVFFQNEMSSNFKFKFVPAIIILKNKKEVGRIIENPLHGTLENDLIYYLRK